MPDTATVFAKIECPRCGQHLLDSMRFSWGEVPGRKYRIGDSVGWLCDASGKCVAPFQLRKFMQNTWRWNFGSPDFPNVHVFDEDIYAGNHRLACPSCEMEINACAIVVRNGTLQKAIALESSSIDRILGSSRGLANVAIDNLDGTYSPREDWFDCPVVFNKEGL
jgi:hypothetical protein